MNAPATETSTEAAGTVSHYGTRNPSSTVLDVANENDYHSIEYILSKVHMNIARRLSALLLALYIASGLVTAQAQDKDAFVLTIRDHKFQPEELQVPAGKKIKLVVKNLDPTAEEFESHDLKREKIIAGNSEATLSIGPLKAGTYKFVGEYNEKTAKGRIVAK